MCLAGGIACANPALAIADQPSLGGKRVLFLGDSITQDGTYVSFIEYYLQKLYADQTFDIISIGLSSETVSGLSEKTHPFPRPCLHERLGRSLDKVKPDMVVACYGMNDGIYHPQSADRTKRFQDGIMKLINDAHAVEANLILLTPPPFDRVPLAGRVLNDDADDYSYERPYYRYNSVLEDYSRWITGLHPSGVFTVDLNTPMTQYLNRRRVDDPAFCFSKDGIHPSRTGHLMMARIFLKALGVPIEENDLDSELSRVTSDPLFSLVDQHRKIRSSGWLAYVGYTRGETVREDSISDTEQKAAALQKQIDQMTRQGNRRTAVFEVD